MRKYILSLLLLLTFSTLLRAADLSDPRKTLAALSAAIKAEDLAAVRETWAVADANQAKLLDDLAAAIIASHRMEKASADKFGAEGKTLVDEGASLEGSIDDALKHVDTATITINGDQAVITFKSPTTAPTTASTTGPATVPVMDDGEPNPLYFLKVNGTWHFDAAKMMNLDDPAAIEQAKVLTPRLAKAWGDMAADISGGKFKTVDEAKDALGKKMGEVLAPTSQP